MKNVNNSNENVLNTLNEVLLLNNDLNALEVDKLELLKHIENNQILVDNLYVETFKYNETVDALLKNKNELSEFGACPVCGSTLKED